MFMGEIVSEKSNFTLFLNKVQFMFGKIQHRFIYALTLFILGLPVYLFTFILYLFSKKDHTYDQLQKQVDETLAEEGLLTKLEEKYIKQLQMKQQFFNEKESAEQLEAQARKWAREDVEKEKRHRIEEGLRLVGKEKKTFTSFMQKQFSQPWFFLLTLIPGLLMYAFMYVYSNPYIKYIWDRLIMTIFVILGVIVFVFTILYISPFDPAANILGETATAEQIERFNALHGLDQSYFLQLWDAIRGIFTLDLGLSFEGNEDISASIMNRFPVTVKLAVISLLMAMVIAIPIGIISATRPNSFLDYTFMFVALIGLSIPNFWQGLIFILTFSIKLQWLPATFNPTNSLSMIMPIIVLGTALTASVARMTRASMLEIMHEDYMMTAKSKGLSNRQVLWKHAIRNAMIPITTVIGLLFGGMLGGAAVTEKVFNISGIGSYIVDKQFIPDIPSIMAGVVYVAITISLVNVIIDIMYAFFDPRIRSKMKEY